MDREGLSICLWIKVLERRICLLNNFLIFSQCNMTSELVNHIILNATGHISLSNWYRKQPTPTKLHP